MCSRTRRSQFARPEALIPAAARILAMSWLVTAVASSTMMAQSSGPDGQGPRGAACRGDLDSLSSRLQAATDASDAPRDRRRPRDGDFEPGDRIVVTMRGDSTRIDTVMVQSDRTVILQRLPPISLEGVPRSELQACLSQQLQQYIRHGSVSAIPLVPVGVLGEVVHPGYYHVSLGITIGDLLMAAGGPSAQADMMRVKVRRGRSTLLDAPSVRDAMVRRLSLDELGIHAGDEVVLAPTPQRNWLLITQVAGVATGLLLTLRTFKVF